MNFPFLLLSSILIYSVYSKSVKFNVQEDNKIDVEHHEELAKNTTKKSNKQLEDLKENIGRVGNKLEGIVYEVLKDFLEKEFDDDDSTETVPIKEVEASSENNNLLEKYHPTFIQNKNNSSSVIDDEVVPKPTTEETTMAYSTVSEEDSSTNSEITSTVATETETSEDETTTFTSYASTTASTTSTVLPIPETNLSRRRRMAPPPPLEKNIENPPETPEKQYKQSGRRQSVHSLDGEPGLTRTLNVPRDEPRVFIRKEQTEHEIPIPIPQKSQVNKPMGAAPQQKNPAPENPRVRLQSTWDRRREPDNVPAPPCNRQDDFLEKQHIEDLKYEVGKLRTVVDLLKEQQHLLNSFDHHNMDEKELLQVLHERLNSRNQNPTTQPPFESNQLDSGNESKNRSKKEELQAIKVQLKDAIQSLNKTKEILSMENQKEVDLEAQLQEHKTQIEWLKLLVEKFIVAQTKRKNNAKNFGFNATSTDAILGAFLNRSIPSTVRMAEEKQKQLKQQQIIPEDPNRSSSNSRSSQSEPRASSLEKLFGLPEKKSDDDDIQLRLLETIKDLRRQKEKEHFTKDLIKKLEDSFVQSKSDDNVDDLMQILKVQKLIKDLEVPAGRDDEFELDNQLKNLQKEINRLRPVDEFPLVPGENRGNLNDPVQFQAMLTRLIATNPQFQGVKLPPITPQQLIQLQKKFGGHGAVGVGDYASAGAGLVNSYGGYGKIPFGQYNPSSKYGPIYGGPMQYPADYSKPLTYNGMVSNIYPSPTSGYSTSAGYGYGASKPYFNPQPYKPSYSQDPGYGSNQYSPSYFNPYENGAQQPQYGEKPSYGGASSFFQEAQPNGYGGGPPAPYYPSRPIDAPGPDRFYQAASSAAAPYTADKIEDLKAQIYGLQSAINSYNRPEYTQTQEDKNTIYNLEQQIDELKNVVNTLNPYSVDQQYSSGAVGSSYDSHGSEPYNRNSDKRSKRSEKAKILHEKEENSGFMSRMSSFLGNTLSDITSNKRSKRATETSNSNLASKLSNLFEKTLSAVSKEDNQVQKKIRKRRSVEDNTLEEEREASGVINQITSVLGDALNEEDGDGNQEEAPKILQSAASQNVRTGEENLLKSEVPFKHATLDDIKNQINHLKKQLGQKYSPSQIKLSQNPALNLQIPQATTPLSTRHSLMDSLYTNTFNSYGGGYGLNGLVQFPTDLSVKPKKLDIFKSIVAKIMDKVIESLPVILKKLFGFAVHELTAYDGGGGYGSGYESGVINVFRNLGIFGYIPIIILRLLNAVSSFIQILQKNKFLKYFLIPAGIVLLVAGSMVFLIWWMQPNDYYNMVGYDEKTYDKNDYENEYQNEYENGYYRKSNGGPITRTFGIEDGKNLNQQNRPRASYNNNQNKPVETYPAPMSYNNIYHPFYKPKRLTNPQQYPVMYTKYDQ